jgi:excisionase family DNA binding protein
MTEKLDEANNEILTVDQVAAYLKLSEATIYRMAKTGRIPAKRIGRSWRFSKELIDEWFRGGKLGGATARRNSAHRSQQ